MGTGTGAGAEMAKKAAGDGKDHNVVTKGAGVAGLWGGACMCGDGQVLHVCCYNSTLPYSEESPS